MVYPSLVDYRIVIELTAGGSRHVEHYSGDAHPGGITLALPLVVRRACEGEAVELYGRRY